MAKEDVNIKVSSNVAEAIRMWQAMEEGPKGMAAELEKTGRAGKKANKGMHSGLDKVIGKWTKIAAGLGAARTMLLAWIEANAQAKREMQGESRQVEEQFSKYRVQASVSGAMADADKRAIMRIAGDRGVDSSEAFAVATQFVSSGYNRKDVIQGGVLDEFLRFSNASNALRPGVDLADLAKQTALFGSATGQEKTLEDLRKTVVAVQRLFEETNLQASGLGRFAEEAGQITTKTHLSPQESLALYSTLLDKAGEAKSSTAFRSFVTSLPESSTNKTKESGLKLLGLKPEDVDFEGESALEVLGRLAKGIEEAGPVKSKQAVQQIFGAEGGLAGDTFLKTGFLEELKRRVALTADAGGYEAAVRLAESSDFAALRRAEVRSGNSKVNSGVIREQTRDLEIDADLRNQGYSNYSLKYAPVLKDFIKDSPLGIDIFGEVPGDKPTQQVVPPPTTSAIKVDVTIQDQNGVAIPARSAVKQLGK